MNGKKDKAGFDGDNMGMTQERQREIQASLFKMLGQADEEKEDPQVIKAPKANGSKREISAAPSDEAN